jgi:uncharacterized phosphatase
VARFRLIRHGEAEYGLAEERRLKGIGRDLVPLTPAGVQQVEELAKVLPEPLTLLISSPMTRALQSTAILAARLSVPVQVEFDLHEWMPDLGCTYDSLDSVVRAHAEYVDQRGEWRPGIRCDWEARSSVIERGGAKREVVRLRANAVLVLDHLRFANQHLYSPFRLRCQAGAKSCSLGILR